MNNQSLEQKARRVAKSAGFVARKSHWRAHSIDNHQENLTKHYDELTKKL